MTSKGSEITNEHYLKGLNDVLPLENPTASFTKEEANAVEWLDSILRNPVNRTGGVVIDATNYDKEFKRILKVLNKEYKQSGELAHYYPIVKKAILAIRRAVNRRCKESQ